MQSTADLFNLGLGHHRAGQLREAELLYRQILSREPHHFAALHMLGCIAHVAGKNDSAVQLINQALAIQPNYPSAAYNLGNVFKAMGRWDDAIASWRRATVLKPDYFDAYNNIGAAYFKAKGQLDEAIAAFTQAIAVNPDAHEAHSNLSAVLQKKRDVDGAIAACRRAIALKPDYGEAWYNLACGLADNGQVDEAIPAFRKALSLCAKAPLAVKGSDPAGPEAWKLAPDKMHGRLLFTMHYHPGVDAAAMGREQRLWNDLYASPLSRSIQIHDNDPDPRRRLRVGYVSADYKSHASAYFLLPLFEQHDRKSVELVCYSEVRWADDITRRLQKSAALWRDTLALSDDELARKIRDDRIDILVDLKMHTGENRLMVFAQKPAPIQVAWLGYPGGTGLSTIDYRLSDPYLDPPGPSIGLPEGVDESVYSEKTLRLPDTFWCYDPFDSRDLPVGPLPLIQNGYVTFGCLNSFIKINEQTLRLWGQVLMSVRDSRLLLRAPSASAGRRVKDLLSGAGVDAGRVELVPDQDRMHYLQTYGRIDIALDTFPYNGHTTSMDSFWMGVPVITLVGKTAVSRAGLSQLSNLGLAELAGETPQQFTQIAVDLAGDSQRLNALRSTLRSRMQASPLMDAVKFARNMESAYREIWRNWREKGER